MRGLSISKLARAADVSADTVRFYERAGLMYAPVRAKSGYRAYTEADLRRLILIRRARALGLSLEEIAALLAIGPVSDTVKTRSLLKNMIDTLDQKRCEIQHWHAALSELEALCLRDMPPENFLLQRLMGQAQLPDKPDAELVDEVNVDATK